MRGKNIKKRVNTLVANENGSTFLTVLMMVAVLSILGIVLISATTTNFTFNQIYIRANQSFYQADGVMERVHASLERVSVNAQMAAKQHVESNMVTYIEESEQFNELTGETYVDHVILEQLIIEEYKEAYEAYIDNDNGTDPEKITYKLNELAIALKGTPGYEENHFEIVKGSDSVEVYVKVSRKVADASTNKKIEAVFEMLSSPEQIIVEKIIKKDSNPIWERPLTTEKDLIVVGGKVNIEALDHDKLAVYAWGTVPVQDNRLGEEYGGIVAGLDSFVADNLGLDLSLVDNGRLEVLGRVATHSYIHTFNSNSEIIIHNSEDTDVFAQSIQTEWSSHGGNIHIKGNVKISNDIEINGVGDTITIEGSLFGFSSGDHLQMAHNKSSAIIYNDPTYTSKIDIRKKVYIGGLAYIDAIYWNSGEPYIPYKTGESAAIGKNFYAYTYPFADDDESSDEFVDDKWKFRVGESAHSDDPSYPMYAGVVSEEGPNFVSDNRRTRFMEYALKHFKDHLNFPSEIQKGNRDATNYIQIGEGIGGRVEGYSLGALPANGFIYMPNFLEEGNDDYVDAGIREFHDYESLFFNDNQFLWKDEYENATYIVGYGSESKTTSEFPELVLEGHNPNIIMSEGDLYLWVKEDTLEIDFDDLSGNDFSGLIYTEGDLYIKSEEQFNFTGAMVAKGSIIFYGNGEKKIIYSGQAVRDAISLNDDAYLFFSKGFSKSDYQDVEDVTLRSQATKNVVIKQWNEVQ